MTTMPIAMLMIPTTKTTTMTTMMRRNRRVTTMMRRNRRRCSGVQVMRKLWPPYVRIEIADVRTTNALIAASKDHSRRVCADVQCPHCDRFGHVNKLEIDKNINIALTWM
jgi:hypothetical protein